MTAHPTTNAHAHTHAFTHRDTTLAPEVAVCVARAGVCVCVRARVCACVARARACLCAQICDASVWMGRCCANVADATRAPRARACAPKEGARARLSAPGSPWGCAGVARPGHPHTVTQTDRHTHAICNLRSDGSEACDRTAIASLRSEIFNRSSICVLTGLRCDRTAILRSCVRSGVPWGMFGSGCLPPCDP